MKRLLCRTRWVLASPLRTSPRRRRRIGDRAAQAARGEDCRYSAPKGVPVPALPWTKWSDVGPLLVGAVGITLVSLTDTVAAATSFAAGRGDEVDPDQEMVGIGTSNIAAGFLQGFAVCVSGCRAAVADQSGARTQLTGLPGAGLAAVGVHWHSSSHAIASRTWCAVMASTPRWTESTSIPASTRPWMRSTMRPRTALCRPMKGCRLHENRP